MEFRNERFSQSMLSDRTMRRFAKVPLTNVEKQIASLIRSSSLDSLSKSEHDQRGLRLVDIDELSKSEHDPRTQRSSILPSISNSRTSSDEWEGTKQWWDTNDLVPDKLPEDYNMLFHNLNDPIMLTSTIKGNERSRAKLLEAMPTTIEDITIRFNGRRASDFQDDGYLTRTRKNSAKSTATSDGDLSALSTARTNDSLSRSDHNPKRTTRSFLTDAANFLKNGLQGL